MIGPKKTSNPKKDIQISQECVIKMIFRSHGSGGFMVLCIHMLFKSIFDVISLIQASGYPKILNIFNCMLVQRYIFGYYYFILECSLGYYGYNCSISCDGCLSDSCDSEYGICADTSGCKPGWQPWQPKCDIGILMKK